MIVVIADDFSGAAELAGVALRRGSSAEVQTVFSSETKADVVCVDTNTRSLSAGRAAGRVSEIAMRIIAAKPAWIFKKCDSVLRGPVLAEARAVADAAGKMRVTILSANPSRGRVIRAGRYFVEGVPLHETDFARDPEHPCTTSNVAELLGGDADRAGVFTPDVETMGDVTRHASTLDEQTLPVGAADFFQALLQARAPLRQSKRGRRPPNDSAGATLLVCGSVASWTQRRSEATTLEIPLFALPYDLVAAVERVRATGRIVIGIGDGPSARGLSPVELRDKLAETVAQILRETPVARLFSEGGATTAAVMRAMGWTRLEAVEIAAEGVGALAPLGKSGPLLFIKPGSYKWPKELWPPPRDHF